MEQGGRQLPARWRPPLVAVMLAVAGLVAGLVVGYAVGGRHASSRAAPRPRSEAAPLTAGTVTQSVGQCSAQVGRALQLGVQVTNQSAARLTLLRVRAVLPLGRLKVTSQAWGPCGELPVPGSPPDNVLPAGGSTWFTVTFEVLISCPAALPVQFALDYDQSGRSATIRLPGFVDLSHVPYAGCPPVSP